MVNTNIIFDPTQTAGSKFTSSDVRAEIAFLSSADIPNGAITSSMLADGAVDTAALAADSVDTAALAADAVEAANIAPGAVTSDAFAPGAVVPASVGTGIPTATNVNGAPITMILVPISSADYAGLGTPSPNTMYFLTG